MLTTAVEGRLSEGQVPLPGKRSNMDLLDRDRSTKSSRTESKSITSDRSVGLSLNFPDLPFFSLLFPFLMVKTWS